MDKQIEEITKDIAKVLYGVEDSDILNVAYFLDEQGYRKIPEGAVVLTREEADTIYGTLKANEEFIFDLQEATMVCKKEMEEAQEVAVKEIEEYVQQVRKETAEKFAERLKKDVSDDNELHEALNYYLKRDYFEYIDERCKEITEGV